ncbi:MAG: DNA helicase RecQ, partial [Candidatus Bipolaricaulota bacterium]|nr:DNA helicase RecQ [Candidatus Bipolaricaulota bacterium]
ERIAAVLRKHWGYGDFRPLQREAMECALHGRDSLVVLPTGGGKSLCFQAPALVLPGLAVVVSPLISLMKDQVDALHECGVAAARLDSSQTTDEQDDIVDAIQRRDIKILYVSPERLMMNGFARFLRQQNLSLVAVDEAHCVSMWGHDFRPEYRQLGTLRDAFPGVALHAYTATATEHVRDDIVEQLKLANPRVLVGSFDRPNLIYSVERRTDALDQVREVLDRHKGESAIVYCIRRADVDSLAEKLSGAGYRAAPYHAGLPDDARKCAQDAFIREEIDVIVATVAFGMGIDKSNVRAVVHAGMPKSLEHYQQESGRAGRDGLDAECVLLYGSGDYAVWRYIIEQSESQEARSIAHAKLDDVSAYAAGAVCRHRAILKYFGQELAGESCNACDVCFGDLELLDDALVVAQKIVSCVYRLEERYGGDYTASVLVGSRDERVLANGHDALSTYGLLSDVSKKLARDWIEQLVGQGVLAKEGEYDLLKITDRGRRVLRGQEIPRLLKPAEVRERGRSATRGVAADSWDGVDRGLFDTLRVLRRRFAEEKNVPAYIVFTDAALRDMARRRPSSPEAFREVPGVGEAKARQYGDAFVAAIVEACESRSLEMNVDPTLKPVPKPPSSRGRKTARATVDLAKQMAYGRFDRGEGLAAVADAVGKPSDRVLEYLLDYLREKRLTSPEPWVEGSLFARVVEATARIGLARPISILRELEGAATFEQVQISIACIKNG